MAWCKTNTRQWFVQLKFFLFKSAWSFACAFQFSSKTFPCIFFGRFALCFWVKRGQNIEACTMNATSWNRRKPFFKFSAHLLVRVDVVQLIKARVRGGWFFLMLKSWIFPLVLFFPLFALLLSGECFTTILKSTCKHSGTFEEKKFHPKKSLTLVLHQAIQIMP